MIAFDGFDILGPLPVKRARSTTPPPPDLPPLAAEPVPMITEVPTVPPTRVLMPHEMFLRDAQLMPPPPPRPRAPTPPPLPKDYIFSLPASQSHAPQFTVDIPMPVPNEGAVHDINLSPPQAAAPAVKDDPRRDACLRWRTAWCPLAGLMRDEGGVFAWLDGQNQHRKTEKENTVVSGF